MRTVCATLAALIIAACGSAGAGGHDSVHHAYTESDNPCVNSRLANGTWQQNGSRALALIGAEMWCSYGRAFDYVSDPATGVGPNTSGWSYPGRCNQMPACLNEIYVPTAPPPNQRPEFTAALAVWKQTPLVGAAFVSGYLLRAADDLKAAHDGAYAVTVRELTDLASLPSTGNTAAQMAQAQADVASLNTFFGTPGLKPNV